MQAAREERIAEKREMLKQEREFNRKKEYARRIRNEVRAQTLLEIIAI